MAAWQCFTSHRFPFAEQAFRYRANCALQTASPTHISATSKQDRIPFVPESNDIPRSGRENVNIKLSLQNLQNTVRCLGAKYNFVPMFYVGQTFHFFIEVIWIYWDLSSGLFESSFSSTGYVLWSRREVECVRPRLSWRENPWVQVSRM